MPHEESSQNKEPVELSDWFETPIGSVYRHAESALLSQKLRENFRAEVLQLDFVGWEDEFHEAMRFAHYTILDKHVAEQSKYTRIVGETNNLPIETHSVDIVIMPHTLEFDDNPHQVLREVNRVLKPEGIVLLMGFNPWAFWHLPRFFPKAKLKTPWNGKFISRYRVMDWLKLLNFEIEESQGCCLFPLMKKQTATTKLTLLKKFLAWTPFMPAAYFIMAVKRVSKGTSVFHFKRLRDSLASKPLAEPANKRRHVQKDNPNIY